MNTFSTSIVVAAALMLVGCSGGEAGEEPVSGAETQAPADSGMAGMPGMAMQDSAMMQEMESHMSMMSTMAPDSMMAMMPQHRQMASNMLAQMNRDMEGMAMPGDSAWVATVDSVRQDLTRMPELTSAEITSFMPAHHARMMRLMESHRTMMGGMRM